ncbi:MAG TPA: helix-turn-helix domain-containing protein [Syntrophorhabdaceae bacterium]|nr:helix-turn-helix domain-containing protein [Syntrophorhabdaceae bacterium]HOT43062.1 helix-turn-helix domain-containing protein [Syntrophorhabdaceae bacterium]HQE80305.1 helix-turn-helix domain-containing protein [Syntrophorhabdaceae bacterium]HQK46355.1 helix-turn-helix domain-containing protein [Syntrophorhabdaceae bacterium]
MDNLNKRIDKTRLYNSFEIKLDDIAISLLSTNTNQKENILLTIQNYIEKIFIKTAMEISNNNISKASKLLGINRNTLSKKLKNIS